MPVLHAVMARFSHIPKDAIPIIARKLNLSSAEVSGVVSFYHDFKKEKVGHIQYKFADQKPAKQWVRESLKYMLKNHSK